MHHPAHPPKLRDCSLKYLEDITLVEEILPDGTRLFPHTGQLAMVSKAVDKEFFEALPRNLAITDHRGDDKRKYMLHKIAAHYCDFINATRDDELLFLPVWRRDLVGRVAIVQRVERVTAKGRQHGFRFYAAGAYFPDLLLSGKHIAFVTHVFDRFRDRAAPDQKLPLATLLTLLFDMPGLVMRVNHRESALVIGYPNRSLLALTFEESPHQFLFTTCLTINEIHDLQAPSPLRRLDFHHGPDYPQPVIHYTDVSSVVADYLARWPLKNPPYDFKSVFSMTQTKSWFWHEKMIVEHEEKKWHQGEQIRFLGNFHSFGICRYPPDATPPPQLDPLPPTQDKRS